jgi:hypothetical protein
MLDTKYLNCVASTMLEGIDVRCTIPCTQPLYTIKVGILSAATSPLFGRQGDAFGVVVGKLTKKKNTCRGPRDSNTVNQTHRMKG